MLKLKANQTGGAKQTLKALKSAAAAATIDVVRQWHDTMMPAHFTVAGGKKYGFQPRSGDGEPPSIPVRSRDAAAKYKVRTRPNNHYSWKKRRQKGHNKPLVWSGDSERAAKQVVALSSRFSRLTGEVRGTAAMPALSRYFYQYRKDLNQPDKVDELTRTSLDEIPVLDTTFERDFQRHLTAGVNAPPGPAVTIV